MSEIGNSNIKLTLQQRKLFIRTMNINHDTDMTYHKDEHLDWVVESVMLKHGIETLDDMETLCALYAKGLR